jgi:TRAP-type C4-dicarboxylate transport system substrate-binding protein
VTFFRSSLRQLCVGSLVLLFSLAGAHSTQAQQKSTLLRMNMFVSNQDPTWPLWQKFAKDIEDESKGTLRVELVPSEGLGTATNMVEAISRGAPVLQDSDPSHVFNYVPDFAIFTAPYVIKKPEDIEKAWNSEFVAKLEKDLQAKGLRFVTMAYFGTRHILTNKQIFKRADTAGLKMRNAPTRMWNEVSKILGGNPTATSFSEAYSALEQGVADTAEAPLGLLHSSGLAGTRRYISLTGHVLVTSSIIMSQKVYDALPPDAQRALDKVGRAYPAQRAQPSLEIEANYRKLLEGRGIVFNEVDKTDFIKAAASVSQAFPEWSPGLYDRMLDAIK